MAKPEFHNVAVQYNALIKKLIEIEIFYCSRIAVKIEKSVINGPLGMVWYLPNQYVTYPNKNK